MMLIVDVLKTTLGVELSPISKFYRLNITTILTKWVKIFILDFPIR